MKPLYNFFSYLFEALLPMLTWISPKMKLFVTGRIASKKELYSFDFSKDSWLWFHCASLGEFEQAVPLIDKLKEGSGDKILVSFFSPSGYEQKKNHKLIDKAVYLPIDTSKNAIQFVNSVKPKAAFFIKYDFWENYFSVLTQNETPIYMVSSSFRENQVYFKWYGSFFKRTLKKVTHFFVQNPLSLEVLSAAGFNNVTVSGDTRFDRVNAQLSMNNQLDFIETFVQDRLCIVLGSTWPEDEEAFIETLNLNLQKVCFVIAPHEIKKEKIKNLQSKLNIESCLLSEGISPNAAVLIVDAIGYLTKIYSYADIAYVGGAMGTTGLHNILEPAVFGVPVLVGPNTGKFPEASALQKYGGLKVVTSAKSFKEALTELISDVEVRNQLSKSSKDFVSTQVGATQRIIEYLEN